MDKNFSKEEIFNKICEILKTEFEIDEALLKPEANLFSQLKLDSIDAVDLAVRLQQFTDKRISPEDFRRILTLNDVVETVYNLL